RCTRRHGCRAGALHTSMLYDAYQARSDLLLPFRNWAGLISATFSHPCAGPAANAMFKSIAAAADIARHTRLTHERPSYGIATVVTGNAEVPVHEEVVTETPFGALLHFAKEAGAGQPRVLIVAPMAGHFPTLLRNTI